MPARCCACIWPTATHAAGSRPTCEGSTVPAPDPTRARRPAHAAGPAASVAGQIRSARSSGLATNLGVTEALPSQLHAANARRVGAGRVGDGRGHSQRYPSQPPEVPARAWVKLQPEPALASCASKPHCGASQASKERRCPAVATLPAGRYEIESHPHRAGDVAGQDCSESVREQPPESFRQQAQREAGPDQRWRGEGR